MSVFSVGTLFFESTYTASALFWPFSRQRETKMLSEHEMMVVQHLHGSIPKRGMDRTDPRGREPFRAAGREYEDIAGKN